MKRRRLLRSGIVLLGGLPLRSVIGFPSLLDKTNSDIVLIRDGSPTQRVVKALEMLGGIERFVKKNDTVFVKPNMSWDRAPEFAANTRPEVVAEVIRQCYLAGAKKVIVSDRTCNEDRRCYKNSGIEKAAIDAGASVRFARTGLFEKVSIDDGLVLKDWTFHRDALEADVLINVPVLKSHSMAKVTMGFKNMMGLIGKNRGSIHYSFDPKIVDINRILKPHLTILDATNVMIKNGPSGGRLEDVVERNLLLAGIDPVLVDTWGATLFNVEPESLKFLNMAAAAGLGSMDYKNNVPGEFTFQ